MTPISPLPTHLTLKLYRDSYDALYRQMQLLRVQEIADIRQSRDLVDYFNTDKQWTTVLMPLWLHDWKAPDRLTFRPGKPANIRLRLDLCFVLYGYLESQHFSRISPLSIVFGDLHQLLTNTMIARIEPQRVPVGAYAPQPVNEIITALHY